MPHHIVFVLFAGFQQLDIAGPLAAFEIAEHLVPGHYRWHFAARTAGLVRSSSGLCWPAAGLPRRRPMHTLMLSGGDGVDAASADPRLLGWLRRAAASPGLRITSVCSGSLLLAQAGLLDGRAATTHWSRTRQFQRLHPQVALQPDRIYVQDGRFWTSAGISAGIDLALALIGHDLGEAVSRRVAQQLVVYHRRPGGQSQFSALLDLQRPQGRFAALLDHVRGHLHQVHTVETLAEHVHMSPRHFARAFAAETGRTPARAVERLRVEAARAVLASGTHAVQQVARDCGFGQGPAATERMRRAFVRLTGQPPTALRRVEAAARRPAGAADPAAPASAGRR
ncbi:GlxA family transcriptional regulator [Pseudorhodoferax sp.]|uniref:GlxA family transcriptional regulator n=1 Tax=Pseudorhodoferax sp. TaxID=1993553 RepID=UPI002DD627E3|nr:GlxA family transcriptional regulator [Pseudorhodoferax sp.]